MSAAEKLKARKEAHIDSGLKVVPIFRKTGSLAEGSDAFSRARDVEAIMDALPQIVAVVEAAEAQGLFDVLDDSTAYPLQKGLARALTALDEALS